MILVRHGESVWNVERRVQGQAPGVLLSDTGREQARAAASALAGRGATRLLSSDLERAAGTAAIIGARINLRVELDAALREQSAGSLEGRLATELPTELPPPGVHLHDVQWAGGESVADVHARVTAWLHALRRRLTRHDTAIVVSHGGTIQVLRAVLADRGPQDVTWKQLRNGEILTVGDK